MLINTEQDIAIVNQLGIILTCNIRQTLATKIMRINKILAVYGLEFKILGTITLTYLDSVFPEWMQRQKPVGVDADHIDASTQGRQQYC